MTTTNIRIGSKLLSPADTATRCLVSEKTLAQWRWRGVGPKYIKVGARIAYREADLEDWLARRERSSTSEGA